MPHMRRLLGLLPFTPLIPLLFLACTQSAPTSTVTLTPTPSPTPTSQPYATPVASVTLNPRSATLAIGQTRQLATTLKDANGNVITGLTVIWASSNQSAITVSATGLATGVAPGSATITATSKGITGTAQITVGDITAASVTLSPQSATLAIGQSRQLIANLKDANGNMLTGLTVVWSSFNPSAIAVSATGLATGVAPGSTTITATSKGITGTAQITVGEVTAASLTLSPQLATLAIGQNRQLATTLKDANGNVLTGLTVIWASSNQSAITVSATGLATGVAPGSTTITATSKGITGTAQITVTDLPVASVNVRPQSDTLTIGQTRQLAATLKDANGNVLTGLTVTWTSSNQSAATVSATGLVKAIAQGSVTITATASGKSGTALFTVTEIPVASVIVNPSLLVLLVGQTRQLVATATDTNGNVINGLTIVWSSSDPSVATVSSSGLVTGKIQGSAIITATAKGISDATTIKVVLPQ
jgi:uncharacterized protein YjdB